MKLLLISDIHGDLSFFPAAEKEMRTADLIVVSGDLTSRGSSGQAEKIISIIEGINRNIAAVHGNWDGGEVLELLEERGYSLHARGRVLGGIGFFGAGGSSPTPMNTPTEYSEDELAEILQSGYRDLPAKERVVLVSHAPPRKTRDRTFLGIRGGSQSVRQMIEEHRVDLCLCGHIHEAAGVDMLNGCRVANPGSFKKGKYMTIDIDETITVEKGKFKK